MSGRVDRPPRGRARGTMHKKISAMVERLLDAALGGQPALAPHVDRQQLELFLRKHA